MRFYVDDSKEEEMRIFLKEERGRVHIMGVDHTGCTWTFFTLLPNGTFRRPDGIRSTIGIQVDPNGKIKESP